MGGAVGVGLCRVNLKLIGQEKPTFSDLFSGLSSFAKALGLRLLAWIKIALWSFLFIIPGVIASYRYSMANFVLAEDPELKARDAIKVSKAMMKGNKWRLFCLHFSFFGWILLATLPAGICGGIAGVHSVMNGSTNPAASPFFWLGVVLTLGASLLLQPYTNAATTAFYLDISGQQERLHKNREKEEA